MKRSMLVALEVGVLMVAAPGHAPAQATPGSNGPLPPPSQSPASAARPARSGPEAERFVRELVARMTLEEKIAQLRPVARRLTLKDDSGVFSPELAGPVLKDGTGYVGRVTMPLPPRQAAVFANAVQRYLMEKTRLGIPALSAEEALHGFMAKGATAFPQAIALASTWDPALVERVFTAAALEARARGANWALTPVLDIAREPRWGRTEETLGEDPFLVSRLGAAAIRGLQGPGPGIGRDHVMATAKHFAAHGQPEGGTNTAPVNVSERILREQLLPSYEAAVREAGVASVMASYNEIDGIPSHVNRWLLVDLLRGEWGFQGIVCSDGGGIGDLVTRHHVATDLPDAVRQAIAAGIDVELDGTFGSVAADVRSGRIDGARIDEAVARVLRAKLALGLFDDPYVDPERAERVTNSPEHRALALEAARKAIVLLKNESVAGRGRVLPLDRGRLKTIAVIGPNAALVHTGGYTYDPAPGVSVLDGIRKKLGGSVEVRYAEGARITEHPQGWKDWWDDDVVPPRPAEDAARIAEAVAVAKGADAAVLVVGENEAVCREGWSEKHLGDRDSLDLPGRQAEMVKAVAATGTPTIVLLINGRPLSVGDAIANVPAVLEGFYLGEETGTAVADVLFGDANPGGKLPITFPRNVGQLPAYHYQKPSAKRGFLFSESTPLFPFGHGLSYTSFRYGEVRVDPPRIPLSGETEVSVEVTNAGERAGDEVVQLYVHERVASVTRPIRELRGFERVTLAPGETRTVRFRLEAAALAFYDREKKRVVEPGTIDVMVGGSSADVKTTTLGVMAR
jgi:beta-glucosidase